MANIVGKADLNVSATMQFSESELRALDALVGYGIEPFIKTFYEKMGTHYMKPHEQGLRDLFKSVHERVPFILGRADAARKAFKGE